MKNVILALALTLITTSTANAAVCIAGDKTPPPAVSISLATNSVSDTGAMLLFNAPNDPSGLGNYQIKVSTVAIGTRNFATSPSSSYQPAGTPGAWEAINIPNLNPNTKYYVAVKAVDGCGNVATLMSNVISFTTAVTPPPPPPSTVTLQWDPMAVDNSPGYTLVGYRIKYGYVSRFDSAFSSWQFTTDVVGLQNGQTIVLSNYSGVPVYFVVIALYTLNTDGSLVESGPSNQVEI